MRLRNNKKGFAAGIIPEINAYIVWIFIILIFLLVTKFTTSSGINSISAETISFEAQTRISDYINLPIEIEDTSIRVSDLIKLYMMEKDSTLKQSHKTKLDKFTENFLIKSEYCTARSDNKMYIKGFHVLLTDNDHNVQSKEAAMSSINRRGTQIASSKNVRYTYAAAYIDLYDGHGSVRVNFPDGKHINVLLVQTVFPKPKDLKCP